jgi:hypothetical protein
MCKLRKLLRIVVPSIFERMRIHRNEGLEESMHFYYQAPPRILSAVTQTPRILSFSSIFPRFSKTLHQAGPPHSILKSLSPLPRIFLLLFIILIHIQPSPVKTTLSDRTPHSPHYTLKYSYNTLHSSPPSPAPESSSIPALSLLILPNRNLLNICYAP